MVLSIFSDVLGSLGARDEGKNSGIAPRLGIASGQGDKDMEALMKIKYQSIFFTCIIKLNFHSNG